MKESKFLDTSRIDICLDVDGVLFPLYEKTLTYLKNKGIPLDESHLSHGWDFDNAFTPKQRKAVYGLWESKNFTYNSDPYPWAHSLVKTCKELGNLTIVTSSWLTPTWVGDRQRWLKDQFGISHKDVIFAHRKERVIGDLLIDDKPKNIEKWMDYYAISDRVALIFDHVTNGYFKYPHRLVGEEYKNDWPKLRKMVGVWYRRINGETL